MKNNAIVYLLSLIVVCSVCRADLIMKIVADDTTLAVGQTTTLRVYGWAEEAAADNGLYDWGVSALVDSTGIVQANSAVILEPTPLDAGNSGYSLNLGATGNIDASGLIQGSAPVSNAGVGYSELFNFQIEGIGLGSVQYSLANILGDLFDFSAMYDSGSGNVTFDAANSLGQISVVPEPASLLILSGLSVLSVLRRKK